MMLRSRTLVPDVENVLADQGSDEIVDTTPPPSLSSTINGCVKFSMVGILFVVFVVCDKILFAAYALRNSRNDPHQEKGAWIGHIGAIFRRLPVVLFIAAVFMCGRAYRNGTMQSKVAAWAWFYLLLGILCIPVMALTALINPVGKECTVGDLFKGGFFHLGLTWIFLWAPFICFTSGAMLFFDGESRAISVPRYLFLLFIVCLVGEGFLDRIFHGGAGGFYKCDRVKLSHYEQEPHVSQRRALPIISPLKARTKETWRKLGRANLPKPRPSDARGELDRLNKLLDEANHKMVGVKKPVV